MVGGLVPQGAAVLGVVGVHLGLLGLALGLLLAPSRAFVGGALPGHHGLAVEHRGVVPALVTGGRARVVDEGGGALPGAVAGRAGAQQLGVGGAGLDGRGEALLGFFAVGRLAHVHGVAPALLGLAEELLDLRRVTLLAAGHGRPQVEVEGLVDARLAFALVAQGGLGAAHLGGRRVALTVGPGGHRRAAGRHVEKAGTGVAQQRRGLAPALGAGGLAAQLEVGLGLLHQKRAIRPHPGRVGGGRRHRPGIGRRSLLGLGNARQGGQDKGQPTGQPRNTQTLHRLNPAPFRGASSALHQSNRPSRRLRRAWPARPRRSRTTSPGPRPRRRRWADRSA